MNSDSLEALEAAAEEISAPAATSRSPSFDPSDCSRLLATGEAEVFSWPSSEKEFGS